MFDFLTTTPSQPPELTLGWHAMMFIVLILLTVWVYRYRYSQRLASFFKGLQWLQITLLYSWYAWAGFPLAEALPLYHCRLAMFTLLLLPKPSVIKDYAAFLGMGGAICAFAYPVFDPFGVWHVTLFSYLVGHYALWGNALFYLFQADRSQALTSQVTLGLTVVINTCLIVVNHLTGGNYGFLAHAPLVNSDHIGLNLILVSLANIGLVTIVQTLYRRLVQNQPEPLSLV